MFSRPASRVAHPDRGGLRIDLRGCGTPCAVVLLRSCRSPVARRRSCRAMSHACRRPAGRRALLSISLAAGFPKLTVLTPPRV
eukprot:4663845-Prymnesium_polylepis.1